VAAAGRLPVVRCGIPALDVSRSVPAVQSCNQFSTRRDGTRSNSRVLAVTSVSSAASACAASPTWQSGDPPAPVAVERDPRWSWCPADSGATRSEFHFAQGSQALVDVGAFLFQRLQEGQHAAQIAMIRRACRPRDENGQRDDPLLG
jgi:hypothetical protein